VPHIFEKIHETIKHDIKKKSFISNFFFNWAVDIGKKRTQYQIAGKTTPIHLNIKYLIAHQLVFQKIKSAFGERLCWAVSGAAPLNPNLATFFNAIGILVLEGYGLSETTSFSHLNRYNDYRFGTVGKPGVHIECKLAADGEILIRGPNVMQGYYKLPVETSMTIDSDGWLYTGDVGTIDPDGFLTITGRKKDLIITSGGQKVAPSRIELMLLENDYIEQACVIGERRKYITALVTLNADNVFSFAKTHHMEDLSIEELRQNPVVICLIKAIVKKVNKRLAAYETIKQFRIVPDFTIEDNTITPTLKIKRNIVVKRYTDLIEEMYK
jgi:long-chain acyl-CoA synthetase